MDGLRKVTDRKDIIQEMEQSKGLNFCDKAVPILSDILEWEEDPALITSVEERKLLSCSPAAEVDNGEEPVDNEPNVVESSGGVAEQFGEWTLPLQVRSFYQWVTPPAAIYEPALSSAIRRSPSSDGANERMFRRSIHSNYQTSTLMTDDGPVRVEIAAYATHVQKSEGKDWIQVQIRDSAHPDNEKLLWVLRDQLEPQPPMTGLYFRGVRYCNGQCCMLLYKQQYVDGNSKADKKGAHCERIMRMVRRGPPTSFTSSKGTSAC